MSVGLPASPAFYRQLLQQMAEGVSRSRILIMSRTGNGGMIEIGTK